MTIDISVVEFRERFPAMSDVIVFPDGLILHQSAMAQCFIDVRKKITQIFTPPLAISTIKARARKAGPSARAISIKPLNDSGLMLATLTHVVTGGGE
ncbi:hypothetical protein [Yersinia pseudotuberculosis]|uniref:hypothetical protein n=1 Tax=Yersinia pseudotuberculosis TaxID=633 RepID=UPI0005E25022|nr:hypothetical protein [Yersinia pseudotuberculosis]CNC89487.1 Uncharacterised protein [Yersinia pseudotuberculosis]